MAGGCGSGFRTIPRVRAVYAMRHGQTEFGSDNPPLTPRGRDQLIFVANKHFTDIDFDMICYGTYLRHIESLRIIEKTLKHSSHILLRTHLLSLTDEMNNAAEKCTSQLRNHPDGLKVGFRVDTWIETDVILMNHCFEQFQNFLRQISKGANNILAISSSPLIESATEDPENTRLLGNSGIIKYIIDDEGKILSSEMISEGFFR